MTTTNTATTIAAMIDQMPSTADSGTFLNLSVAR